MKDKILEILKSTWPFNITKLASEIDTLTREHYATGKDCFGEWCVKNIETGVIDMIKMRPCYYLVEDPQKYFETLPDLYNYWLRNIKDK